MDLLKNTKYILVSILLLAFILRFFKLDSLPPSLNWDEISHGYNAYSILKTGSDEWGEKFPMSNFRAYGDYPLALNLYLTIPFVALLGLTEISIRSPHAILGILEVLAVYYLSLGLTKKKNIALLSAFLVAITPWYVFTSRFVLQSNLAVFFLTAAMAFFFNRNRGKHFTTLAIFFLGLTLYSYHSTRIFTPLLMIPLIALFKKELVSKINVIIFLLFFLPLPFILLNPNSRARSNEVFLLNPNVVYSIEVARNNSNLPDNIKRVVYNRPVYLITNFAGNYLKYFSPQFLFLKGGTQYQFSVPNHGLMFISELPFFYFGLIFFVLKAIRSKNREYLILLAWLLLSPIPASITTEQYAVLRSTPMLPIPEILTAIGFFEVINLLLKRFSISQKVYLNSFLLLTIVCLGSYIYFYSNSYAKDYSWAWQFGYKEVVTYARDKYDSVDKIIFTKKYGEPHEYVLFFNEWEPSLYKSDKNLNRFTQSNWWWVDGFDKYIFVNDWEIPKNGFVFVTENKHKIDCSGIRCLLITSPGNSPDYWKKIRTVNFLDGKPAFEIYEN